MTHRLCTAVATRFGDRETTAHKNDARKIALQAVHTGRSGEVSDVSRAVATPANQAPMPATTRTRRNRDAIVISPGSGTTAASNIGRKS
jgi:hypothetical protein